MAGRYLEYLKDGYYDVVMNQSMSLENILIVKFLVQQVEEGNRVALIDLSRKDSSHRCRPFRCIWRVLELHGPIFFVSKME